MTEIVKYDILVFIVPDNKLSVRSSQIKFIGTHFGTDKQFTQKYHKEFPNSRKTIFRSKTRPPAKSVRDAIESFIEESPMVKKELRDYKLGQLLKEEI